MCVVILNLPEFIIKSNCLLLAVPRDSPNCKKHNEENTSFGREYDVRMRSSTRRNLVRTSNSRRNLGRVNFRKDFWDCYKGEGENDQKWLRWWARPHLSNSPKKKLRKIFRRMDLLCPKTKERCKREKIGRYNWNWSLNREPENRHLWTKFRLQLSRNVMDLQRKKTNI